MTPPEVGFVPTIGAGLRRAAANFGDRRYLVSLDERWTYADAERVSALLARSMLGQGVGKGTRVGLFFTYGGEFLVSWLAASRIGAVVVPLSTLYTASELRETVRSADIHLLIAAPQVLSVCTPDLFEAAFPSLRTSTSSPLWLPDAPFLRHVWLTGPHDRAWASQVEVTRGGSGPRAPAEVLSAVEDEVVPADVALVVHTSGTSSRPKGVVHSHGTVMRQSSVLGPALHDPTQEHGTAVLCSMPFFWIGGILALAGALHAPLTILCLPRLLPGPALELMERERSTGIIGFPTFVQQLRAHPDFERRDLSSANRFLEGPSDISMLDVPDELPFHRGMSETAGSFFCTDVRVIDPDSGHVLGWGEEGELLLRGPGAMLGYNKREPWEVFDADGWYHTGDRVYRLESDPRIFFAGRYSELIKPAGANVSPKEVEAVLDEYDEIVHSFVLGTPDDERGEAVVAVVVVRDPDTWDEEAARAHTRAALSSYKVPSRWLPVDPDDLPMLGTGKIDRRALRQRVLDGDLS